MSDGRKDGRDKERVKGVSGKEEEREKKETDERWGWDGKQTKNCFLRFFCR